MTCKSYSKVKTGQEKPIQAWCLLFTFEVIDFSQLYDCEIDNDDFGGLLSRVALDNIKV